MSTATVQMPEAFGALFDPSYRTQIWHGGRGGGKTWAIALALVIQATEMTMRVLCCREIQKSIDKSSKKVIENTIRKLGLSAEQGGPWVIQRSTIINRLNGSDFIFEGLRSNIDSVRSTEGIYRCWIEEAANTSSASWRALTPTVRLPGSQLICSLNRQLKTDFLDREFIQADALPPRTLVQQVNHDANPWFPGVLREEMEWMKQRDYQRYLHVWEGEPLMRSDAAVFNNLSFDDLDDDLPANLMPRFGADWGSTNPTVLAKVFVWHQARIIYLARTAYKIGAKIVEIPSLFAGDAPLSKTTGLPRWENPHRHPGIPGAYTGRIRADGAWPGYIGHLRDLGFNIVKATKGPESVREGVDFLRMYDLVIHPDCKEAIYEFQTYSFKVDKDNEDIVTSELEDEDNHVIDATRYAVEEDRRQGPRFRAPTVFVPPVIISGPTREDAYR